MPFLSKKEGIDKEIEIFKAIRRRGREWLPLMHDLTNCLRTADFSVFRDGLLYRIIELKIRQSSKCNDELETRFEHWDSREARQEERVRRILAFLEDGDLAKLSAELMGGRSLKTQVHERHNFDAISAAIRDARRMGYGLKEPDPGLLYLTWDLEKSSEEIAIQEATKGHPHMFDTPFTFRSINPRSEAYHLSLPVTEMALPARDLVAILFYDVAVICMVDYAYLEEFCSSRGVPLKIELGDGELPKIVITSRPHYGEVREGLWDRIMLEGLSFEGFVGLIQAIMDEFDLTT